MVSVCFCPVKNKIQSFLSFRNSVIMLIFRIFFSLSLHFFQYTQSKCWFIFWGEWIGCRPLRLNIYKHLGRAYICLLFFLLKHLLKYKTLHRLFLSELWKWAFLYLTVLKFYLIYFMNHVIKRGAWSPWTVSIAGQCVAPGGPQSCKPREFANRWVNRWAILNPPLPSNCVKTIITCLQIQN